MNAPFDPACSGKTRYLDKGAAVQCVARRKRSRRIRTESGRHGLNVYRCSSCKFWHIGSSSL